MILKAALNLLIREGYAALNIKALAKELGSSTQPVSWHFGAMEGLRKALAEYDLSYANEKMHPSSENGFEAFTEVGEAYINIAFDEPNLFRFLYMGGDSGYCAGGLDTLTSATDNAELIKQIAAYFSIPRKAAGTYLQNTIIYTHGLAALIASGVMQSTKTQVCKMVNNAGNAFLLQAGVDLSMIEDLGSMNNRLLKGASSETVRPKLRGEKE
jgi:AcrR family transcriptional regulator